MLHMRGLTLGSLALLASAVAPAIADAGWVVQWTNTAVKSTGERMPAQSSSMAIAGNRVRTEQPEAVTLMDCNTGRFSLLNPDKQYFWSGTVDDYVREVSQHRASALQEKMGQDPRKKKQKAGEDKPFRPKPVDPAKLQPVSITKTGETEKIAGYDTEKYAVLVNGELFQEIWVAPSLDVSADLNWDRYLADQRKLSAAMLGKSGEAYSALYFNDEYRKLLAKSFALKTVVHHIAGGFERAATSVRQADVPASDFEVPESYRKVRLTDVLSAPAPGS